MRKIFTSEDFGAPAIHINTVAGAMITVMQGCLVDGYGNQTPTSITRVGAVATMVLPNAHGFTRTGVLNISGCDQVDYNGEFRITVVNATTVTFAVANSPATPATGTIVCRQDGAGWTTPFTDVNKAAFKQGVASNGFYLDVDDTVANAAKVRAYESMTAVGVGTAPFPTVAQEANRYWAKGVANSQWVVVADEHFVMVWTPEGSTFHNAAAAWFFGDFREASALNGYNTILISGSAANTATNSIFDLETTSASNKSRYVARDHTGLGGSRRVAVVGDHSMCSNFVNASSGGVDYPDPASGAVYIQELRILAAATENGLYGYLDGVYTMLHAYPFGQVETSYFAGSDDFSNDEFVYLVGDANTAIVIRVSD